MCMLGPQLCMHTFVSEIDFRHRLRVFYRRQDKDKDKDSEREWTRQKPFDIFHCSLPEGRSLILSTVTIGFKSLFESFI